MNGGFTDDVYSASAALSRRANHDDYESALGQRKNDVMMVIMITKNEGVLISHNMRKQESFCAHNIYR